MSLLKSLQQLLASGRKCKLVATSTRPSLTWPLPPMTSPGLTGVALAFAPHQQPGSGFGSPKHPRLSPTLGPWPRAVPLAWTLFRAPIWLPLSRL